MRYVCGVYKCVREVVIWEYTVVRVAYLCARSTSIDNTLKRWKYLHIHYTHIFPPATKSHSLDSSLSHHRIHSPRTWHWGHFIFCAIEIISIRVVLYAAPAVVAVAAEPKQKSRARVFRQFVCRVGLLFFSFGEEEKNSRKYFQRLYLVLKCGSCCV